MAGYLLVHGEMAGSMMGLITWSRVVRGVQGMTGRVIARDRRKTERVVGDERR